MTTVLFIISGVVSWLFIGVVIARLYRWALFSPQKHLREDEKVVLVYLGLVWPFAITILVGYVIWLPIKALFERFVFPPKINN